MAQYLRIGAVLLALVALAGCDSETEVIVVDCVGPDLGFDGHWFGAMEDDTGALFTLEWQVCGDRITREAVNGFASSVSGQIWPTGTGTWEGRLSDGTWLRLLSDPARRHLLVVNDLFEFAVLERGATGLPGWFLSDLDGQWRGLEAYDDWRPAFVQGSAALCGGGRCDTVADDGFAATLYFDVLDAAFGMYRGDFVDSAGNAGLAGALMSPDLLFLGTYTCPDGFNGPWDCTFGALSFD
ncbi:hypothetical protein [Wenzhouxiangella sp. XN24]|uniref:hypothetical protein n=1 Tax=Wenzhouxiangella sp. XN24 TaxID=2713569 RepID=UPI0013EBAEA8|nr:hypothetical protein [Wenzhouxiangella sp. XN24]NGX16072.1 hypothetical protein [Wenzhouxiangella sp. XN24]